MQLTKRPVKTRFRYGYLSYKQLTSLVTLTRRIIMQKARRHLVNRLRPIVSKRFQELFHSLIQGTFHLSLTVLVHYRSIRSI